MYHFKVDGQSIARHFSINGLREHIIDWIIDHQEMDDDKGDPVDLDFVDKHLMVNKKAVVTIHELGDCAVTLTIEEQ